SPVSRGADYAFISTTGTAESPAYCASHRFAASATGLTPRPFGLSRYGAIPACAGRGLPTALPAVYRLVPHRGSRCGLRRYERDVAPRNRSRGGQALLTRQGISLP